jgi:glycosyltransferase involved in cell wall biosynthesis
MKILQIATSTDGGAGIAASRLNSALNALGFESVILSGTSSRPRTSKSEILIEKSFVTRILSKVLTVFQSKLVQKGEFLMTPYSLGTLDIDTIMRLKPGIIHLHAFYNLLSTRIISEICDLGIPVFISLHDERFYTGGCHYALECPKYQGECSDCPQTSSLFQGITSQAQKKIINALKYDQTPTVIAPSEWISSRAKASKAMHTFDVIKINNPLSLELIEKSQKHRKARDASSPYFVTFVAQDLYNPYKGLVTLLNCIEKYRDEFSNQNIQFIFVGKGPKVEIGRLKWRQYEKTDSLQMVDIYLESDLLIVPSLADNSPSVVFEALVCGTPFVGSDRAGIPELSETFGMESFKYGDSESMFRAILKQKEAGLDSRKIREDALAIVHPEVVAKKISQLYFSKSIIPK